MLKSPGITDPANEFRRLAELLRSHDQQNQTAAYGVFSSLIRSEDTTNSVLLAVAIANKRANDLRKIISRLHDDVLDQELKDTSNNAISLMQNVFAPERLGQGWSGVIKTFITSENIVTLKFLTPTIRAIHPLPIVSEELISLILVKLDAALADLVDGPDLPLWAQAPLVDGIAFLRFKIENIIFFGHDEAISGLLSLYATTSAAANKLEREGKNANRLRNLVIALLLIKDVFTAPTDVAQSLPIWSGWGSSVSDFSQKLIGSSDQTPPAPIGDEV